ncbi:hypothetical protein BJV82DRAFT_522683 [Fennellomyces sp. T-0311]|nr:hypothetical protein BJV82DRAFT_522683 [Fennellomyces sp. T-0311]
MTTRLLLATPSKHIYRCYYQQTSKYYTTTLLKQQSLLLSSQQQPSVRARRHHGTHSHNHIHADIATTFEYSGKKGVRITMIGLASNVGLTVTKGLAGWFMNSAALLADAAHSASGKFETVGSLAISSLLIAGAIGIGVHSFDLLQITLNNASSIHVTQAVQETAPVVLDAQQQVVEKPATGAAAFAAIPSILHDHASHSSELNPNAAWIALSSVLVKEWLYRATLKIGRSERSEVLVANAWHHRSDALSSGVAMIAIGGSYAGISVLDPLGGLLVAGMIMKSSATEPNLLDFHSIRGRKLGPFYHVDMALKVNPLLNVQDARRLEQRVRSAVQRDCEQVQQMIVRLETPSL